MTNTFVKAHQLHPVDAIESNVLYSVVRECPIVGSLLDAGESCLAKVWIRPLDSASADAL